VFGEQLHPEAEVEFSNDLPGCLCPSAPQQLGPGLLRVVELLLAHDREIVEPVLGSVVIGECHVDRVAEGDFDTVEGRIERLAERDVPVVVDEHVEVGAVPWAVRVKALL
jgi:hypothetical protein